MMKSLALLPLLAFLAHVAVFSSTSAHASSSTSSQVPRGVSPSAASLYVAHNGKFTCLDKSRTIDFAAVNDDYCDCADGSDEPGTAACQNSTFYCHNQGHLPGTIPSSRVNDGICDPECCDGSDEYDGKVTCPNKCESVGKEYRARQTELARVRQEGLRIKMQYRLDAANTKAARVKELSDIESELKTLTTELTNLRAKRDAAETDEQNAQAYEAKLGIFSPRSLAARVTRLQTVVDQIDSAIKSYHESNQDKQAHDTLQRKYNEARSHLQSDDLTPLGEVPSAADVDDLMPQASFMDRARFLLYGILKPGSVSPLDIAKKNAETARQAVWDAEAKVRQHEIKRDSLLSTNNVDVGPESAWSALVGKCFSNTHGDTTYELCPFQGAHQRPTGQSWGGHSLGKWGKWVDNGSAWQFDHGDKCWSGPIRNTKITLECGEKELVKDFAEPIMCEFSLTFVTPAACKEEDAQVDDAVKHNEL